MSEVLHNKLNKDNDYPLQSSNYSLSLADDGKMTVKGEIKANILINDNFENFVIFPHNILVISNIRHNLFLGNDIISTRVYATTQQAIIFNKIQGKTYNTTRIRYNPNFIIVPFLKREKMKTKGELANVQENNDDIHIKNNISLEQKHFRREIEDVLRNYSIDDENKEEYRQQAIKKGTLDIPVSNYIDIGNKVQSIEMKDLESTFNTVDELFNIIETNHLPLAFSNKTLSMLQKLL